MSFIGDWFGGSPDQMAIQETTTEPPAYALPYLETGMERVEDVYQRPRQFYPEKTYVDFSPTTLEAIERGEARASAGSPLVSGAQNLVNTVMGGGFLNPAAGMLQSTAAGEYLDASNPYLAAALQPAIDRVQGQYSGAGRLGSGANITALTSALAPTYARNYATERANQLAAQRTLGTLAQQDLQNRFRAAQAAPGFARGDYDDIGQLAKFGQARESQTMKELADRMKRFDFLQGEEERRLANYLAGVKGGTVGGVTTQPIYGDKMSSAIGNIGAIANIGKTIWDMV